MDSVSNSKMDVEDDEIVGTSSASCRPRLIRRSSTMLDCMKYRTSMAHEIPPENRRKKYSAEGKYVSGCGINLSR